MSSLRQFFTLNLLILSMAATAQSGALDPGFSGDGIATLDGGTNTFDLAYAGALQPDGKILIAGWTNATAKPSFFIARYQTNGTLDNTFGNNGSVVAGISNISCRGSAIALQTDGKIVVAGSADSSSTYDFLVLRLLPDGTPDSTFGSAGWVTTDFGTTLEYANAVAIQRDGKIIAAGRKAEGFFSDFAMVRLLPDGQPDPQFGDQGLVGTNFREEDNAAAIVIQDDSKIILGGFSSVSANGDFALARYNQDGSLDKLFGSGGKVLTDLAGQNESDFITSMKLLSDGRIVTAGNANNNNLEFTSDAGIVQFMPDGALDPSFGTDGIVIAPLGSKTNVEGVTVAADGKVIICGSSDVAQGENRWFLSRFQPQGGLDISFGTLGVVTTNMQGANNFAGDVLVQPDSKIVLAGTSGASPNFNFAVARYIADFNIQFTSSPISCIGAQDGQITVHASGGIAPYLYSIDGGFDFQESNTFTDLPPGTYVILVQDQDGLGNTGSIGPIVIEDAHYPPTVDVEVVGNTITILVADGGHPPYQYSIDGTNFVTSNVFSDLADGTYLVLVQDAGGCIIFDSTAVIQVSAVRDPLKKAELSILPNPSDGLFQLGIKDDYSNYNSIAITDMTGRVVYTASIHQDTPIKEVYNLHHLQTGSYALQVIGGQRTLVTRLLILR